MAEAVIVGVDEAGRGALAGPVVAGACVLQPLLADHPLIRDSKVLTAEQRDEAYTWINRHCAFGIGIVDAAYVDDAGILAATERAMQEAVAMLAATVRPTYLLVDGRDKFWFDYPHSSVIDGDALEPCIAAASIVAKVTRDRLMIAADATHPGYGFARHKAYGTPEHFSALREKGPCPLHRRSFLTGLSAAPTTARPRRTARSARSAAAPA